MLPINSAPANLLSIDSLSLRSFALYSIARLSLASLSSPLSGCLLSSLSPPSIGSGLSRSPLRRRVLAYFAVRFTDRLLLFSTHRTVQLTVARRRLISRKMSQCKSYMSSTCFPGVRYCWIPGSSSAHGSRGVMGASSAYVAPVAHRLRNFVRTGQISSQ